MNQNEAYRLLAAAVVTKACEDYMSAFRAYLKIHDMTGLNRERIKREMKGSGAAAVCQMESLESFFRSQWCAMLTDHIDGDVIITTLQERVLQKRG